MTKHAQLRPDAGSRPHVEEVCIRPPLDGVDGDALRAFLAGIYDLVDDEPRLVGTMCGWIAWYLDGELYPSADQYSGDAAHLAFAVDQMARDFSHVVLLDHVEFDSSLRGQRLLGGLLDELRVALKLEARTLVVGVLEPLVPDEDGVLQRMDDDPARDRTLARLQQAYADSGFRLWHADGEDEPSDVWWCLR